MCMLRQARQALTDWPYYITRKKWVKILVKYARTLPLLLLKVCTMGWKHIWGSIFVYDVSIILLSFFILNYFTDVSLTSFGFIFVQKRIFVIILKKRMWTSKIIKWCWKSFFIRWTLVRWSFRKYFVILWCTTLPSNGTAAWLMDKNETIQGKSGHEKFILY